MGVEKRIRGLSSQEVKERRQVGLVNKPVEAPSKTLSEIIRSNVFTYFNLVFLIIAVLLTLVRSFRDLTFLPIIIANTVIGILQEWRAKQVLDKLTILHAPKARVLRDGDLVEVLTKNLVLDDIILLKAGDQIAADAEVVSGEVAVNEALLTGEADEIIKPIGAGLMSGSFVVSGECYAKLTKVGADSYISQLTLKAKAIKTGEQSEIIRSLNGIVRLAGIAIIPIGILLFSQQYLFGEANAQVAVQAMVAAIIGMIPEGLFLLASVTLAISAMRLALDKVLVHDMKCIETLARVDVLCVDKTGTITNDEMELADVWAVKNGEILKTAKSKLKIKAELADFVYWQKTDNQTMQALKKAFENNKRSEKPERVVGFSSTYKHSGLRFQNKSLVLGAPEFLLKEIQPKLAKKIDELSSRGYRVLVFGKTNEQIGQILTKDIEVMGVVVLSNSVRETVPATFKYFAEQGVEIKVISGDNTLTVAEVAKQAGILNAEKAIDATTLQSDEKLATAAQKYTVFGRVTPEQKRKLIKALKKAGRTVAMTGDGVNDVLALKDADCSVAMASGSEAAVQASQLVLLESDFAKMPSVVREGRRVVNNLERSGSLFLVKNIFSLITAVLVICFSITYPLIPTQVSLVTLFTIGIPSFLLAQIPNQDLIKGQFIRNILRRAAPAGFANVILISTMMMIGGLMGFEYADIGTACTVIMAVVGSVFLYKICKPLDLARGAIFGICLLGMALSIIFLKGLFGLEKDMAIEAWIVCGLIVACVPFAFRLTARFTELVGRFLDDGAWQVLEEWYTKVKGLIG